MSDLQVLSNVVRIIPYNRYNGILFDKNHLGYTLPKIELSGQLSEEQQSNVMKDALEHMFDEKYDLFFCY